MDHRNLDFIYGNFRPSEYSPGEISLVKWNSTEGQRRLNESDAKEAFFRLAHFYQPQINPTYCGIASAVIVLNAIAQPFHQAPNQDALTVPLDGEIPLFFPAYSQLTFLGELTQAIKSREVIQGRARNAMGVLEPGVSLATLQRLIAIYGFECEARRDADVSRFRTNLQKVLAHPTSFLIAHFRCDVLGGVQFAHISPLAAWHRASDSVLVLDTGGHKSPWFWVPVEHLFRAMAATYSSQPSGGGYVEISAEKRDALR
jgi:hypothetical protein